jgi:protein-disulfide isomerase
MSTPRVSSAQRGGGFRESGRFRSLGLSMAVVGLVVAIVAAGALVWMGLWATTLPGCGGALQGTSLAPQGWGGCAQASGSMWGRIELGRVGVSTAALGLATYVGAVVVLLLAGTGSRQFRWVMRSLLLTSIVFLFVAINGRFWCPYCMAAHCGVLLAWMGAELRASKDAHPKGRKWWISASGVSLVVVSVLSFAEHRMVQRRSSAASTAAAQTILQPNQPTQPDRPGQSVAAMQPPLARFTGRYLLGSDVARARIVVISDFQCADCQKLDRELMELAQRADVSLSMKHFPFCTDCNANVPRTLHANACWAARAAEAAGMAGGNSAFWTMQKWLFSRGGAFTEAELRRQVASMGIAADRFMPLFTGRDTLDLVKADVAEAMTLGISRTPMVFVNGVECPGWENPGTVTRIVNAVLQANLPHDPAATDQPPRAMEKYLSMWRAAPVETPAQPVARQRGDGVARIEVIGDYQESGTRELCQMLSDILSQGWSAGFVFVHYPADPACNPAIPRKMNDRACELSTLVLAAGIAGGEGAYWKAHDAALRLGGQKPVPADLAAQVAAAAGVNAEQLLSSVPAAQTRLSQQVQIGQRVQISELPTLFINGRRVARWKGGVDSRELLGAAIMEACNATKRPEQP